MCDTHSDLAAEFFCVKDYEFVCYKCALVRHQGHEIKEAQDVNVESRVNALIEANEIIKVHLGEEMSKIEASQQTL